MRIWFLALFGFVSLLLASEGKTLFEAHCLKCHTSQSNKPVEFLKKKYKGNAEGVVLMAHRCPWGKGLSDMEIKLIAEWLSGKK